MRKAEKQISNMLDEMMSTPIPTHKKGRDWRCSYSLPHRTASCTVAVIQNKREEVSWLTWHALSRQNLAIRKVVTTMGRLQPNSQPTQLHLCGARVSVCAGAGIWYAHNTSNAQMARKPAANVWTADHAINSKPSHGTARRKRPPSQQTLACVAMTCAQALATSVGGGVAKMQTKAWKSRRSVAMATVGSHSNARRSSVLNQTKPASTISKETGITKSNTE